MSVTVSNITKSLKEQSGYELKDLVGHAAVVVTLILFLSGTFICRDIRNRGNTNDISPLPFLTACCSCTVWLMYGSATGDVSLCIVNGIGLILQLLYLTYYYFKSINKRDVQKKLLLVAGILCTVLFIAYFYRDEHEKMTKILGFIASSCTLMFMGSPLFEIAKVCRSKSTKILPFPLIVTSFISSLLWSLYGILINDKVVQFPNMLATLVTVVQLSLFVIFRQEQRIIV